jgi:hypothetical protein
MFFDCVGLSLPSRNHAGWGFLPRFERSKGACFRTQQPLIVSFLIGVLALENLQAKSVHQFLSASLEKTLCSLWASSIRDPKSVLKSYRM